MKTIAKLKLALICLLFVMAVCSSHAQSSELTLTAKEKAWLEKHPVIRVSNEKDYAPLDFQSGGKPTGYSVEYVQLLAERLGIQLEFVTDTWANLLERTRQRDIDVLHTIFELGSRSTPFHYTRTYKDTPSALITRSNIINIKNITNTCN